MRVCSRYIDCKIHSIFYIIVSKSCQVAALTPKAELEGDMGDSKMGLQARLMSQALRKLHQICSAAFALHHIADCFFKKLRLGQYTDHQCSVLNQGDGSMLQFSCRICL